MSWLYHVRVNEDGEGTILKGNRGGSPQGICQLIVYAPVAEVDQTTNQPLRSIEPSVFPRFFPDRIRIQVQAWKCITLYHVSKIRRPVLHDELTMLLGPTLQGPAESARRTSNVAELGFRTHMGLSDKV